ncbi:hypothetical protein SAMN04488556_3240 [Halostagnicola kamekurae]|uniref:Uncharacterized protein n=1 Tax=Halostagnicola kamekurae TaxID=619731 RepID=A0A1I6TMV3_9EURY|nr:hypothetical protein SAMN04488556_3240 [Halostagnicola kamekurae]
MTIMPPENVELSSTYSTNGSVDLPYDSSSPPLSSGSG